MQKHLNLIVTVLILCSVLLLLVIIGPEVRGSIEAADEDSNIKKMQAEPVTEIQSEEKPGKTTQGTVEENKNISDVTCEIVEPKVTFGLKYQQYPLTYTYILVQNSAVHIRTGPSVEESVIRDAVRNEKLDYIETVKNNENWYHISWKVNDQARFGFVNADVVTKRIFQFDKMHDAVQTAVKESQGSVLTYINNYHNRKGYAPLYHGQPTDNYGGNRSQSAPGYLNPADLTEFHYISDGTLVKISDSGSKYTKVSMINSDKVYFIPNNYIATPTAITEIKKAVVIDRGNQNEVVFEKTGEDWKVISYTLATTGTTGVYQQPTPLGYYYAMEKRERFYYYKDGTTSIQGYAPYALRFSGGAYIHGIPVNFKHTAQGVRIDPGKVEYSGTIGTVPLSHKCVRNYTSHAKFLYDWYAPGEMIVIVME